ncbi:FabD/lysophospholipase-like protein [Ascodesmis nigricans]|uniref:Patatin-like phospholipase domain-containing protein n=1 Tax=Ascodesmis nigricans TaxID=341454 RepID=A0A4V6RHD8_9PEZI|nr:FabD/lysophospholipase-like protein [Ascodesmis nigricans]
MTISPVLDKLPDFDKTFINPADIAAFTAAIHAPPDPASLQRSSIPGSSSDGQFISAHNDWAPLHQKIRKRPKKLSRRRDEAREGFVYTLLKYPLLILVFSWIALLSMLYALTRFYIAAYEYFFSWRGKRAALRRKLRAAESYEEWCRAAEELDRYLGVEKWKEVDEFAYYDSATVKKMVKGLREARLRAEKEEGEAKERASEELRVLVELAGKNNFAGVESARLYSQTYLGTKKLVQEFVDEVQKAIEYFHHPSSLPSEDRRTLFKHLSSNYGRSALCLSGGASFAYYHFGVIKAHLNSNLLPKIITGTSGGALIASLVCTRSDSELRQLLVPELADKLTACHDSTLTWLLRWYRTGARFDATDWASRLVWFTRGSTTFLESYQHTGRSLNISCVPSDPHSPSLLLNHLTAPHCTIFSAVLASAAVPGILNPVVLMTKHPRTGKISPWSFGNKWKDGSLRTDIPLKALNLTFNVNFSLVSQVNPHVNIFFFSSRGAVGRPVTHRRGRGWRGGFLGSAVEQYLKLDLAKWLKVARHLELLPRPMEQDWSAVFLQRFEGSVTVWPKTRWGDFYRILTDPTRDRLKYMLRGGEKAAWPELRMVRNRLVIERAIERGRELTRGTSPSDYDDDITRPEINHHDTASDDLDPLDDDDDEYASASDGNSDPDDGDGDGDDWGVGNLESRRKRFFHNPWVVESEGASGVRARGRERRRSTGGVVGAAVGEGRRRRGWWKGWGGK